MINMHTQDTTLTCSDCGQEFTFTASEQLSYAQKGQGKPSQCAFCRAARKIASGARNLPGGGNGGHQMYLAVCARCGRQTKVPFEPRGDRPVYCSTCYEERRGTSGSGYERDRNRRSSYHR